jgi:hypothetical protein
MTSHPNRIVDPSMIAAAAAFAFVAGVLVGSPAVLAASALILALAIMITLFSRVMRRLQVLPQPAQRSSRPR